MEAYARFLWDAQIVQLRLIPPWFKWVSGIESPVYVDHRRLLAYPEQRKWAIEELTRRLTLNPLSFQAVVGVATGGIPWAAWLGERLHLPVGYVRPHPKGHGLSRQVEGLTQPTSVLVVEDLISTGESMQRATEALRAEGFCVSAGAALWSYDLISSSPFTQPVYILLTFPQALLYWERLGILDRATVEFLKRWHRTQQLSPP
ncbi:MAG: phosphoribosyltransferase family protein [Bacteroidia bacterium]|nr:phosphoribosyltransferase family protein [Bacteroidia bacterium]